MRQLKTITLSKEYDTSTTLNEKVKAYLKSKESLLRANNLEKVYEECLIGLRGDISEFLVYHDFDIFKYLTYIPSYCFDVAMINHVKIPNTITRIEDNAFSLSWLEMIEIPSSVKTIGKYAFKGCEDLKKVVIHEGVTELGKMVFKGCDSLDYIEIPKSVTSIGKDAFKNIYCPVTCMADSYTEQYCKDNKIEYKIK